MKNKKQILFLAFAMTIAFCGVLALPTLFSQVAAAQPVDTAAAADSANTCSLAVSIVGDGAVEEQRDNVDPMLNVEIGAGYVILENSQIYVKYADFVDPSGDNQFAIREFRIKSAGSQNQIGGSFLDAGGNRGTLKNAALIYDAADKKTVRLEWNLKPGQFLGKSVVHEVSIIPNGSFIEINYIDNAANFAQWIVDLGQPGGTLQGTHVAHGGESWVRGYVTFPDSFYNRYPGDGIDDPVDGGVLAYNGNFIVGVYNPANDVGFGRVIPVADTRIVRLLQAENQRRGFEFWPPNVGHAPFKSYIYGVTGGADEILARGRQLAEATGMDYGYQCGEVVTLTAVPDEGWFFNFWEGDVTGIANPISLTLSTNHVVTANFTSELYNLNITLDPPDGSGGLVDRNPDKPSYQYGEEVTLTAVPQPGWSFDSWGGALSGSELVQTIAITEDTDVSAAFTQDQYTLTVNRIGNGSVTVSPLKDTYTYGEVVILEASADPGWAFANWSGAVSSSVNPTAVVIEGNTVVTANFEREAYTLNITPVGDGSITLQPDKETYFYGDVVVITAVPDLDWFFGGWGGDLASFGAENPAVVTVNANVQATALFTQNAPPVVAPISDQMVRVGQQVAFTVTAADQNNDPLVLQATNLPAGALFVDNGDGTGRFSWKPAFYQVGEYVITFVASDGEAVGSTTVIITVARGEVIFLPIVIKQ